MKKFFFCYDGRYKQIQKASDRKRRRSNLTERGLTDRTGSVRPFWAHFFMDPDFFCLIRRSEETAMCTASRVAVIGIIVEKKDHVQLLNELLSEYGEYVIGRMGIPYKEKNINIISVAVDAPQDVINSLGGKIGKLDGVSAKISYGNV